MQTTTKPARLTPKQRLALDTLRGAPLYTGPSCSHDVLIPLRALVAKGLATVADEGRGQRWTVAS